MYIDKLNGLFQAGTGVTVAYQPQAEIVSYTSQVEHIDSSGDHEAYDYDDPLGSPSAGSLFLYFLIFTSKYICPDANFVSHRNCHLTLKRCILCINFSLFIVGF